MINLFIKTFTLHPFAMTDAQQHNYNSTGKNDENIDQNAEEGSFLKLLWYSATLKTFSHLKGIYNFKNWILLRCSVALVEYGILFVISQKGSVHIDPFGVTIDATLKKIAGNVIIGFIVSLIYKNVGFYRCVFIMSYSVTSVLALDVILSIYGNLTGVNIIIIKKKMADEIPISGSETIYTFLVLVEFIMSIYCLFFYLRKNMRVVYKP